MATTTLVSQYWGAKRHEPTAAYLGIYTVGFLPMLVYNVTSSVVRGLGDSVSPMKFLGYATILNIVLGPLMIFGCGPISAMGVVGTAWATVISQAFSAVLALTHVMRRSGLVDELSRLIHLDWDITKLTVRIGLPKKGRRRRQLRLNELGRFGHVG